MLIYIIIFTKSVILLTIISLKPMAYLYPQDFAQEDPTNMLSDLIPALATPETIPILTQALKKCRIWRARVANQSILFDNGTLRDSLFGAVPSAGLFLKHRRNKNYFPVCVMHMNYPEKMRCYEVDDLSIDERALKKYVMLKANNVLGSILEKHPTRYNILKRSRRNQYKDGIYLENNNNGVGLGKSKWSINDTAVMNNNFLKIYICGSFYVRDLTSYKTLEEACSLYILDEGETCIEPLPKEKMMRRIKNYLDNNFSLSPRILTSGRFLYVQLDDTLAYKLLLHGTQLIVQSISRSCWKELIHRGLYEIVFNS